MNLIAAVDKNWAIGKNGKLLASIRDDMEFFREKTMGNVVVMGRKTLDSLPKGMPLSERDNIVLTGNRSFKRPGVTVCHSLDEALDELRFVGDKSIYIIGGAQIYNLFLEHCDTAYITKIDYAYDADTYFPNLDRLSEWRIIAESDELTSFDLTYRFLTYKRES